jgi:carbon monoxide dehydrogenase subunit G
LTVSGAVGRGYEVAVTVNRIHINAPPEQAYSVLADPARFAEAAGASDNREIDGDWPHPGSRLRSRKGLPGMTVVEEITVVEEEAPRRLVLHGTVSPLLEADIEVEIEPYLNGSCVTLTETPTGGYGAHLPSKLLDAALERRNQHVLERLQRLAVRSR